MTAQLPHDPYRPQHIGPYTAPPAQYSPQHTPYPAPYMTSTPHVLRGDRNGMGTAGLVLGIVSLCLAVIPVVGVIAWGMWPLGVIFSGVGLNRSSRVLATNRSTALAGMVVSLVAAGVCMAWVVVVSASGAAH